MTPEHYMNESNGRRIAVSRLKTGEGTVAVDRTNRVPTPHVVASTKVLV